MEIITCFVSLACWCYITVIQDRCIPLGITPTHLRPRTVESLHNRQIHMNVAVEWILASPLCILQFKRLTIQLQGQLHRKGHQTNNGGKFPDEAFSPPVHQKRALLKGTSRWLLSCIHFLRYPILVYTPSSVQLFWNLVWYSLFYFYSESSRVRDVKFPEILTLKNWPWKNICGFFPSSWIFLFFPLACTYLNKNSLPFRKKCVHYFGARSNDDDNQRVFLRLSPHTPPQPHCPITLQGTNYLSSPRNMLCCCFFPGGGGKVWHYAVV